MKAETLILKWTFGFMFFGVVGTFLGKMLSLVFKLIGTKALDLKTWIESLFSF